MSVVKSQAAFPSELAAPSPGPVVDPERQHRTGIVVVHGIGSQLPAETLLQWTAPLIEVITAWRRCIDDDPRRTFPDTETAGPADPVKTASIDFSSPFPTIKLHVPECTIDGQRHPRREWLITEAWWASNVAAPSLATMINWLGPGGGAARVVDGILGNPTSGKLLQLGRAILIPIVSVIAGVGLALYGLVRSLSALIPIQAVREASILRQFDEFLIGWFGDVRILLFDPAQSANIRAGLATAVARLRERCDRVVVVAHSGGAMISFLTLTDPELAPSTQVDKLVTFGEGWNLALRLTPDGAGMADRLRRDISVMQPKLRWRDFHASHDPAPAGPLDLGQISPPVSDATRIRSFRVWNRLSVLGDHGGYFDNDEEFTIPLLRELDVPDGWGEQSRFYPPDGRPADAPTDPDLTPYQTPRVDRHRQRVAIRALWRQTVVALTVATIALALAIAPEHLIALGTDVTRLLPRVPVLADLVDATRSFAGDPLDEVTFDPPLVRPIVAGELAAVVEWVGMGVLQAFVIMAGLFVLAARTKAFKAWPPRTRMRFGLWYYEAILSVATAFVVGWAATFAASHGQLLGAGLSDWSPGIAITAGTLLAAFLGTLAAQRFRAPVVSTVYAVVAVVLFLVAMACTVLTILRSPALERVEVAYVAIWIGAIVLLSAGNARWANWDRFERRIAHGPVAALPVSRRPVLVSAVGFLVLAATLAGLVLAGPGPVVVYLAAAGLGLVGVGAWLGAKRWKGAVDTAAQPGPTASARGSV